MDEDLNKSSYRKLFVNACLGEAKKQKLDIDARYFCNCSFENLYARILASGKDITSDPKIIDKVSKSSEYEAEVQECLMQSVSGQSQNSVVENELKAICLKTFNKNKFMRKNTDINEICDCTMAKYKDSGYTLADLNAMKYEEATEFFKKISEECVLYHLEKKESVFE